MSAGDNIEVTIGDVFDWLNAPSETKDAENQKLELIDDILERGLAPDEAGPLLELKFQIIAHSNWLTPHKIETALGVLSEARQHKSANVELALIGDDLRRLGIAYTEFALEKKPKQAADTVDALALVLDDYEDTGEILGKSLPTDVRHGLAASIYNDLGAAWIARNPEDLDGLRRAELAFSSALEELEIHDSAPERLRILSNQIVLRSLLGDWLGAHELLGPFDALLEHVRDARLASAQADITTLFDKIQSLSVLILARTDGDEAALERAEQLLRRGISAKNCNSKKEPNEARLVLIVPPLDFPTQAFLTINGKHERSDLPDLTRNGLLAVLARGEQSWFPGYLNILIENNEAGFGQIIEDTARQLADAMKPVLAEIASQIDTGAIASLKIARTNLRGYLPLHCMPAAGGTPLCLKLPLIYEVAADIPANVPKCIKPTNILIVADPQDNLPFARQETAAIAELFSRSTVLVGEDATKERVFQELRTVGLYSHIHFATHGRLHWEGGDVDGIVLRDKQILTANEISQFARLKHGSVVTLAACETGLSDVWDNSFDPASLARTFFECGVSAVIASNWPLPDFATSILTRKLYVAMCRQQHTPEKALLRAIQQINTETNAGKSARLRWSDTQNFETGAIGFDLFSKAALSCFRPIVGPKSLQPKCCPTPQGSRRRSELPAPRLSKGQRQRRNGK